MPWLGHLPFSRSGDVVEYLLKSQWFIRCREMADRAVQVRKDDAVGREVTWLRGWLVSSLKPRIFSGGLRGSFEL